MPGVSKEQIEKAKKIDLLAFLKTYRPDELVQINKDTFSIKAHDSLKISNGKWHWFSHNLGGTTALNYLIHVEGYSFVEAVKILNNDKTSIPIKVKVTEVLLAFELPEAFTDNERVKQYLYSRGISNEVLRYCLQNRLIYESSDYHNAVFVGFDAKEEARYAALRGTWARAKKSFKGETKGSDKRYSFSITPKERSEMLFVTESAIDALSVATLRKERWGNDHYLSIGGAYSPKRKDTKAKLPAAMLQYLEDHHEIKKVILCLDNDEPGRGASRFIAQRLMKDGYMVWDKPPKRGKDYNDLLVMSKRINK